MRMKCLEVKTIPIRSSAINKEDEAKIKADSRCQKLKTDPSTLVLIPNFYERFEEKCKWSDRKILNLKVRYFAAQNGFSIMSNFNKKSRYAYFSCRRKF